MKEKFLNAMKSAWSKTVSWVKDKAVPWLKDKVVPALKKAWDFLKQKGKELLQAIPPTVSRIIRTVEGWLNSALGHISGKMAEKNGDEPKKMSHLMEVEVERELDLLTEIGNTSYIDLQNLFYYDGMIAQFKTTGIDMKKRYMTYLSLED